MKKLQKEMKMLTVVIRREKEYEKIILNEVEWCAYAVPRFTKTITHDNNY